MGSYDDEDEEEAGLKRERRGKREVQITYHQYGKDLGAGEPPPEATALNHIRQNSRKVITKAD